MKRMFTFLSSIRKSYHLYIGTGDLIALKHFIDGYITCMNNTGDVKNPELYEEFCAFVENHYHFDSSSSSIYGKIEHNANSSKEAFSTFFDLLDEFISLRSVS